MARKRTNENLVLDKDALKEKYGDHKIAVVKMTKDIADRLPKKGFVKMRSVPPILKQKSFSGDPSDVVTVHTSLF